MSSPPRETRSARREAGAIFCGKFEKFLQLLHVFVQQGANRRGCL